MFASVPDQVSAPLNPASGIPVSSRHFPRSPRRIPVLLHRIPVLLRRIPVSLPRFPIPEILKGSPVCGELGSGKGFPVPVYASPNLEIRREGSGWSSLGSPKGFPRSAGDFPDQEIHRHHSVRDDLGYTSFQSSCFGTHLSAKLRSIPAHEPQPCPAKRSFGDNGVPKPELGHEGKLRLRDADSCVPSFQTKGLLSQDTFMHGPPPFFIDILHICTD